MPSYDYDLFVIGAGSGGVRAARMSATHGARVGIAEERHLGGTCVNVGCVPKKLLAHAAHYADHFEDAAGFGWTVGNRRHAWPTLIDNKNREIARLNEIYRGMLTKAGVTLHEDRAVLLDAHRIRIGADTEVTADRILIATGGWPVKPDDAGAEFAITSNEVFFLEEMPQRVLIIGGGYIAVEFAGIFNGLGAQVTQLYRGPLFLRGFDQDVRQFLAREMRKKGIDLQFETRIDEVDGIERKADGTLKVTLGDRSVMEVDCVLYATGRRPNSRNLGLEDAGVDTDRKGAIVVDDDFCTSQPNIFAIGDVINRVQLTPVAIAEGVVLADRLFNRNRSNRHMDYADIPTAVFSQPAIGTVGLTEDRARDRYGTVDVYVADFRPLRHTLSGRDERMLIKVIVDAASDRVVGCHMVGEEAPEITQAVGIAIKCGATKEQFDATIGIHPTAAEELVTLRTPRPRQAEAAE